MTKKGITIRLSISDLRVLGRVTQGVRLINLDDGDEIASIAKIDYIEVDELPEGESADNNSNENTEEITPPVE
jgi:DNA gyrase subunit A